MAEVGCFACGAPAFIHAKYELCDVLLCNYCIVAGSLKSKESTQSDGLPFNDLYFAIGELEVPIAHGLRGPVEFASAGFDGIEYFESLKQFVFELTQSISD